MIYGKLGFPEYGVAGAAIATLIARVVETTIITLYVFLYDKRLGFRPRDLLSSDRLLLGDLIRYGLPILAGSSSGRSTLW